MTDDNTGDDPASLERVGPRQVLDVLAREADRTADQIHSLALLNERILATGAALTATAATLIVVNKHYDALAVLPIAFALLASHTYAIYGQLHDKAAYRAALERRVNALVGEPVMVWESRLLSSVGTPTSSLAAWLKANPVPNLIQQALYFAIYLVLDAIVIVSATKHRPDAGGHLLALAFDA